MEDRPLVSSLDPKTSSPALAIIIGVFVVIVGSVSGAYFSHKSLPKETAASAATPNAQTTPLSSGEVGSTNPAFKDTATGEMAAGGLNGEGTHHLIRPGGASQTVYLVSSIVDLDQYVGKKVQVIGQTLKARRVGWLMDVGRIKPAE